MSGSVIVEAALRLAGIAHAMDRPEWLDTAGGHARDCVGPFGATLRGSPAGAGGGGGGGGVSPPPSTRRTACTTRGSQGSPSQRPRSGLSGPSSRRRRPEGVAPPGVHPLAPTREQAPFDPATDRRAGSAPNNPPKVRSSRRRGCCTVRGLPFRFQAT